MFKRYNFPMKNNVLTFELINKLKYPSDPDITSSDPPRIFATIIPDLWAHYPVELALRHDCPK